MKNRIGESLIDEGRGIEIIVMERGGRQIENDRF